MGFEALELRVTTAVSRHNSPRDDADNAAWNRFVGIVRQAAAETTVESGLVVYVMGDDDLPTGQWS